MEPWLTDTLARRQSNVLMPAAPTELLVLTLAFAFLAVGWLALLGKLLFFSESTFALWSEGGLDRSRVASPASQQPVQLSRQSDSYTRVQTIAGAVSASAAREERLSLGASGGSAPGSAEAAATGAGYGGRGERLGSSYRRATRRVSAAAERRDAGQ